MGFAQAFTYYRIKMRKIKNKLQESLLVHGLSYLYLPNHPRTLTLYIVRSMSIGLDCIHLCIDKTK
jgi:hypothetical protein